MNESCKNCREQAKELHKTMLLLLAERQKTELFRQLIEQRYNVTLVNSSSLITDTITAINERMLENKQVSLDEHVNHPQHLHQKQKKVYKSAPKSVILIDEESHENVKEVEQRILGENIKFFGEYDVDISFDMIENNMRRLEAAKTTKDCTTILSEIKSQRQLFQLKLSPAEYGLFLVEHIDRIKGVLSANENICRKLEPKKLTTLFTRILTTLEQRIILHQGFQNQTVDVDEIMKYRQCLVLSAKHSKTYRTFTFDTFFEYFTNFSLALFSVYDMFEIYVANPYGYKNLCYANFGSDNEYAFYHLENYDGAVRYWTMDCRLESIILKLSDIVRVYCTTLFRKIYKLCFNTNDYIEGYRVKFPVLEFDCEQLLRNILLTVNVNCFNRELCNIVKQKCTITPSVNDKFSSYTDNEEQAISFKRYELTDSDIISVVETVFDNIKDSQCLEIYKSFKQ